MQRTELLEITTVDYYGLVGLLIFFVVLVGLSIALARRTKRRLVSAIVATLSAALLVQAISYAHLGYLEPFYQIAFVTSIAIGIPVSLVAVYLALHGKS
jgi:hypothetical protein